jgi:hypothetical protein
VAFGIACAVILSRDPLAILALWFPIALCMIETFPFLVWTVCPGCTNRLPNLFAMLVWAPGVIGVLGMAYAVLSYLLHRHS